MLSGGTTVEERRVIEGYEGIYEITSTGRINRY
jgi:hypothetical protein